MYNNEHPFELVNLDENDNLISDQAGAEIFSCPQDFIAVNFIRLCGLKVSGRVCLNASTKRVKYKSF